jgi:hypothetical protein
MKHRLLYISLIISYLNISAAEPTQGVGSRAAEDTTTKSVTAEETTTKSVSAGDDNTAVTDSIANEDFTDLAEFTIETQRKLVQSDGAKLTYNVTEDPEAGGANFLDILRKVPGVTVDAEDNIKVNGQSNFKVLMNGREDPMLKGDLKTVLKSLPAASIKKIEVISEPGAKYDAEGTGGILNIVTDNSRNLSGFVTQLSGWLTSQSAGGYVDAKVKLDKVMVDLQASYNDNTPFQRYSHTDAETEYLNDPTYKQLSRLMKSKYKWQHQGTLLNMSWEPDTLNLFTLSASYGHTNYSGLSYEQRDMTGTDLSTLWHTQREYKTGSRNNSFGAELSYQHTFDKEGHNLILSYEYEFGRNNQNSNSEYTEMEGTLAEEPATLMKDQTGDISHLVQIDYANPFSEKHLLEVGAKMNLNYTRDRQYSQYGEAAIDDDSRQNMTQFKDIYAAYGSYTGTYGSWGVKGGLRYEYTRMGLHYRVGDYPDFTTYLHDLVPNAAVSYNFKAAESLRLSYQMRISRPSIWVLNPYVDRTTPGGITYGNPDLKSTKEHDIAMTYSNYVGQFTGSVRLDYRFSTNGYNDILFVDDAGIINSTYANIGREHYATAQLNGDWSITNSLKWSAYLKATYNYLKSESELVKAKNCGWNYHVQSSFMYTAPCKLRMSAYGAFYTGWYDLQSRGSNGYYYGLGFSRSFLKDDALTINVGVYNILPVSRRSRYVQQSETLRLTQRSTFKQWNAQLGLTYRFGGLKADVKKTGANLEKEETGTKSSKS